MTPRPFTGLRVLLVAAFNRRYHRSALSLASALKSLGCEVQRCEERWRGVNRILRRPLAGRLAARLRRAPVDVVLVFKVARLAPQDVRDIKACFRARWANWFPDDPHLLETSLRLGPAYDCFFTHDSSSLERHRAAGARAHYLAFGCDPEYLRPLPASPRWATALAFAGPRDPPVPQRGGAEGAGPRAPRGRAVAPRSGCRGARARPARAHLAAPLGGAPDRHAPIDRPGGSAPDSSSARYIRR